MKILFVCTGNTCRSPMAKAICEQILSHESMGDIEVFADSAGLAVYAPSPASANAVLTMNNMDIDLSGHMAKQVDVSLIYSSDLVLTMTSAQAAHLHSLFPGKEGSIYSLGEYAGVDIEIADPFLQSVEIYGKCAKDIEICIRNIVAKLLSQPARLDGGETK